MREHVPLAAKDKPDMFPLNLRTVLLVGPQLLTTGEPLAEVVEGQEVVGIPVRSLAVSAALDTVAVHQELTRGDDRVLGIESVYKGRTRVDSSVGQGAHLPQKPGPAG